MTTKYEFYKLLVHQVFVDRFIWIFGKLPAERRQLNKTCWAQVEGELD